MQRVARVCQRQLSYLFERYVIYIKYYEVGWRM